MISLRKWILALMALWLVSCGGGRADVEGGDASAKARFLALSFWQSQARGLEKIYLNNDRLLLKKSALIAFEGDAVQDYRPEIERTLSLLREDFDLQVTYGYSPQADVNVYLYYGEESRNASTIKSENRVNRIVYDRLGAMQFYDVTSNQFLITNTYRPYRQSEALSRYPFFRVVCETRFHYNDVQLQAKTFWQRQIDLGQAMQGKTPRVSQTPDFSVVLGFMGVPEGQNIAPGEETWKAQMGVEAIKPLAFPCIYEEIVHSLTFWRDLPDPNRVAFTAHYEGTPERHRDGYLRDLPELQKMLSYYNLPGMRAGLGFDEVVEILNAAP